MELRGAITVLEVQLQFVHRIITSIIYIQSRKRFIGVKSAIHFKVRATQFVHVHAYVRTVAVLLVGEVTGGWGGEAVADAKLN